MKSLESFWTGTCPIGYEKLRLLGIIYLVFTKVFHNLIRLIKKPAIIGGLAKSQDLDGFEKCSRSRRANPEE